MAYNRRKKKVKKTVVEAEAHIHATYNNTIVTISDPDGNAKAAAAAATAAKDAGVVKVDVYVKGLGPGRENAIRSLQTAGLEIVSINDETPVPHNGCRPPKRPRN